MDIQGSAVTRLSKVRAARLVTLGIEPPRAQRIAERLALRDEQLDDRRLCEECVHFYRRWDSYRPDRQVPALVSSCRKRQPLVPLMLQRCHLFSPWVTT